MVPALKNISPTSNIGYIKIAREIAIDHHEIETILQRYQIDTETWNHIQADPRFISTLQEALLEWQSATNTHERTKLKAAALIEEWLGEANSRLHDGSEALPAKVELAKLLARVAGMGLERANIEGVGGERFTVTINLGSDHKLKFEKSGPMIEGSINE